MTFSLLGRCARTGMLGAAVTTSSIAVGSRCSHARAAVGACLTQHRTDPRLGPLALDLLEKGYTADQVMQAVLAVAPHPDWRQLAVMDATGRSAAFTGRHVARAKAGEAFGTDCVAIANIVRSPEIPAAMVSAFVADAGLPLADRLIAALAAGEAAGGEFVPVISAALVVVDRERFPYVDLRVDSHQAPIVDLARLWREYEPEAEVYVTRASDPGAAPPA
jgi:uncharacterized Ntn-hydrolase superfamily protein